VANKGLRVGCLPKLFKVLKTRQMLNLKLSKYIGDFYFLTDSNKFPPATKSKARSKEKEPIKVSLNQYNNIFANVKQVQHTMVELYGIIYEGMILT